MTRRRSTPRRTAPARQRAAGAAGDARRGLARRSHGEVGASRARAPRGNAFTLPGVLPAPAAVAARRARRGAASRYNRARLRRRSTTATTARATAAPLAALDPRACSPREGIAADGEVVLYAFPRMLGYVFNPVSFWVCHDRDGAVRAVLCEVRNTFGERHNYLLAHPDGRAARVRRDADRAQGLPRLAVLRGQGPLRVPLPLRRRRAGSRASTTSTTATPRRRCSRRCDLRHRRAARPRAPCARLLLPLPAVHARRRRAHPLAGAEALGEARAVLHQAPSTRTRPRPDDRSETTHPSLSHRRRLPRRPGDARRRPAAGTPAVRAAAPPRPRRARRAHARRHDASLRSRRRDGRPRRVRLPRLAPRARHPHRRRRRVRRGLHGRALGHARPHRAAHACSPRNQRGARARVLRPLRGSSSLFRLQALASTPTRGGRRKRNIVAHYDLGNDFYRLLARPDDDLFVGAVRRRLRRSRSPPRRRPSTGGILAELGAAAGRAHPRDRLRLGRLRRGRRARRLPRDRAVAVRRADRLRARAASRAPGSATACDFRLQDYRDETRHATTASRRSRCSRRSARSGGRRTSARVRDALRARRPRVHPDDHHRRRRASSATARSPTSSSSTSFPGGMLASPSRFRAEAACAPGSRSRNVRDFGPDYAETLRRWLAAFDARRRRHPRAGLRRALHPLLALLPRLLRRRLRQRLDRCRRSTRWLPRLKRPRRVPSLAAPASPPPSRSPSRRRRSHWRRPHRRRCPPTVVALAPGLQPQGGGELTFLGLSIYDGWYWSAGPRLVAGAAVRARPPLPPQPRRREDRRAQRREIAQLGLGSTAQRARWGEFMRGDLPRRAQGRPHHRRPPAAGDRPLLPQRPADRRHRRPRVRARLLRHLARPADLAPRLPQQAAERAAVNGAAQGTAGADAALAPTDPQLRRRTRSAAHRGVRAVRDAAGDGRAAAVRAPAQVLRRHARRRPRRCSAWCCSCCGSLDGLVDPLLGVWSDRAAARAGVADRAVGAGAGARHGRAVHAACRRPTAAAARLARRRAGAASTPRTRWR